jgi:hypothetical protein
MKRFVALMIALGFCAAYGLGCTKQAPKEEPAKTETEATEAMTPPPPPPPAPAAPAAPAPAAPEKSE